jgi:hypothetical protein
MSHRHAEVKEFCKPVAGKKVFCRTTDLSNGW